MQEGREKQLDLLQNSLRPLVCRGQIKLEIAGVPANAKTWRFIQTVETAAVLVKKHEGTVHSLVSRIMCSGTVCTKPGGGMGTGPG